jgi:hypothetical protein
LPFRFWGVEDEVGGKLWGVEGGGLKLVGLIHLFFWWVLERVIEIFVQVFVSLGYRAWKDSCWVSYKTA